jgi:hypothetical protein
MVVVGLGREARGYQFKLELDSKMVHVATNFGVRNAFGSPESGSCSNIGLVAAATLFLFILSFSYIHNHIHKVHSISIGRDLSPFSSLLLRSKRKTSLEYRAWILTQACHTAGQRTTN